MRDFITRAYLSRIGEQGRPVMVTPVRPTFSEAPEPPSRWRLIQTLLILATGVGIAIIALLPPAITTAWLRNGLRMIGVRSLPYHLMPLHNDEYGEEGWVDSGNDPSAMTNRTNGSAPRYRRGTSDGESRDQAAPSSGAGIMPSGVPASGSAPWAHAPTAGQGNTPAGTNASANPTANSGPAPSAPAAPSGPAPLAGTDLFMDPDTDAAHEPPPPVKPKGPYTIPERLKQFGSTAAARLAPAFKRAGISFPPAYVTLIGFKEEKRLQLYAAGTDRKFALIRTYPIRAASGVVGPKLREGDGQVPEGLYRIELLNPNSSYHLSMRVSYPSEYDRERAREDGRPLDKLGGDIMIHGREVSIGCLAMGDRAIEELFVLTGRMQLDDIRVILAPWDLRTRTREQAGAADQVVAAALAAAPKWTTALHERIRAALEKYPIPTTTAAPAPSGTARRESGQSQPR